MRNIKTILAVDDALDRRLKRELSGEDNTAGVNSALHERIMNRVSRSAVPDPGPVSSLALAAGAFAVTVALVGAIMSQAPVNPATTLPATESVKLGVPAALQQQIARLETAPVLPEAALRQEYERLKSDLRKLGIES